MTYDEEQALNEAYKREIAALYNVLLSTMGQGTIADAQAAFVRGLDRARHAKTLALGLLTA